MSQNIRKPRCTIKQYLWYIVVFASVGFTAQSIFLNYIGFGCRGTIITLVMTFPVLFFACMNGFYRYLVRYYGLKDRKSDPEEDSKD